MKRLCLTALLLLAGAGFAQSGGSFANLVITPAGNEEFDISTGVTTLTDGGEIHDRSSGIVFTAEHISYRVDEYIDAENSVVTGSFGTVTADSVHVDIASSTLTAEGGLQLEGRNLFVSGDLLSYSPGSGVLSVKGNVTATDPQFNTSRLLYHTASGTVLLFGPYSFDDGFLRLDAGDASAMLELKRPEVEPEAGEDFFFEVSSTPSEATLGLFQGWLD